MVLRDGMATMSLDGSLAATPLPGVDPVTVEYLHLLPNLLVSAHPDYVMTHRMVPLAPDRTWVECSWLILPGRRRTRARRSSSGTSPTARTGRPASRSSAGWSSPHFRPGPFAPKEDAVAQLVSMIGAAYRASGSSTVQ